MAGKIVDRLPHSCGADRALNVFENEDGSYSGYCFSCNTTVPNPYSDKEKGYKPDTSKYKGKTPEEVKKELMDVAKNYPVRALKDRGISEETCKYLGIKVAVSQENGHDIVSHYYPYTVQGKLVGYKVRLVENKKFFGMGKTDNVEPFGWTRCMKNSPNNAKVYISEGEVDVATILETFKLHGDRVPSVISLPNGAGSVGKIKEYIEILKQQFRDIVIVPDQDEAGSVAVNDFLKLVPEAKVAKLPLKDPNEMLKAGRSQELYKAIMWDAQQPTSGKSVRSDDAELWEKAKKPVPYGIAWPWPTMTKLTRGIRRGETYYLASGQKMGKSCIVNEITVHLTKTVDSPVFLIKPEEAIVGTLKRLAGVAANAVFHDPDKEYTEAEFNKGREIIGDKVVIFDKTTTVNWEDVKKEIRYNVVTLGCKDVFLDPLTCFTVGMDISEANKTLTTIAAELADMAKDLDFTAYVFCHLNKPSTGKDHTRGGTILASQFAGSSAMARFCNMLLGLEGDKDPDLPQEERDARQLVIVDEREYGITGKVPLFFNQETGRLLEPTQH